MSPTDKRVQSQGLVYSQGFDDEHLKAKDSFFTSNESVQDPEYMTDTLSRAGAHMADDAAVQEHEHEIFFEDVDEEETTERNFLGKGLKKSGFVRPHSKENTSILDNMSHFNRSDLDDSHMGLANPPSLARLNRKSAYADYGIKMEILKPVRQMQKKTFTHKDLGLGKGQSRILKNNSHSFSKTSNINNSFKRSSSKTSSKHSSIRPRGRSANAKPADDRSADSVSNTSKRSKNTKAK